MPSKTVTDTTYNGYSNYETWAVGMFLDGNYTHEGTCRRTEEIVREQIEERNAAGHAGDQPFYESYIADALKAWATECIEQEAETLYVGASIAGDLLTAAVGSVDWFELAKVWLSVVSE